MDEQLPPGFRFYPTEEELVGFYLHQKLLNPLDDRYSHVIPVLNIYEHDPWQLPEMAGLLNNREPDQWFFFCPRQEREAQGGRPNRITPSGYWKATGSPGFVFGNNRMIGTKRTMVFYEGRAPTGTKTKWKMNEFGSLSRTTTYLKRSSGNGDRGPDRLLRKLIGSSSQSCLKGAATSSMKGIQYTTARFKVLKFNAMNSVCAEYT